MYVGSIVRIRKNIRNILRSYGYEPQTIEHLAELAGTEHKVHEVSNDGQRKYVTIDLTMEIPAKCCLLIA